MINITTLETVELLREHIEAKRPICLNRLGDGELYFLRLSKETLCPGWGILRRALRRTGLGNNKAPTPNKNLYKWFELNAKGVLTIKNAVRSATQGADILSFSKLEYDRPDSALWGATPEELTTLGLNVEDKYWSPFTVTRSREMGTMESMARLLGGTPVHIINPFVKQMQANHLQKHLQTEVSYTYFPSLGTENARSKLMLQLTNIEAPVVLCGVGGFSKIIGPKLRDLGKIAIDMGATIECWAGRIPRKCFAPGGAHDYCAMPVEND